MSEPQCAPLEEWMESIIDYRGKTPEKTTSGIPLITAKVIKGGRIETPSEFIAADAYEEWMRRGIPEAGDVVITTEAPLGEVAQLPKGKVALAQRVIILRGKKGLVDNTFLKYLLLSKPFQEDLEARATGTTVVGIKQSVLRKINLAFPSFLDQKVIAHILGTLDDKIELNRKTNETLEGMAKALFKSWFVDFDPVRAKAEGRPTGLPAEISDLFPDSFEDSELGEIPSGWSAKKVGEISTKITSRIGARSGVVLSAVKNGTLQRSDDYFTKKVYSSSIHKYIEVLLFDIAFNPSRVNIGSIGINTVVELGAVSPVYIVSRPRKNWHWFFWESISANRVKEKVKVLCSGSVRQSLSSDDFESIQIACPPSDDLVFEFNAHYEIYLGKITAVSENIRSLEFVRDALLPKLISGEIRIPDAEKMLEEVGV
jgi:type I restriction enzyme S subunit